MKKIYSSMFLLALSLSAMPLYVSAHTEVADTVAFQNKHKKSFWRAITAPARWIGRNWSAYDPKYSTPSFYHWSGQLQNNFSKEWLTMKYTDGMQVSMHSRLASKLGPYLAYHWLGIGYSFDVAALGNLNGKKEIDFNINSNLMNIELIYRRTGGDFMMSKMTTGVVDVSTGAVNQKDVTDMANAKDIGDRINYSVTGFNINFFTNHKKYSNPAAFSNQAIQLRSAGSPIIGFGFQRQRITNTIGELLENVVLQNMFNQLYAIDNGATLKTMATSFNKQMGLINEDGSLKPNAITDIASLQSFMNSLRDNGDYTTYKQIVNGVVGYPTIQQVLFGQKSGNTIKNTGMLSYLISQIPTEMNIDDYHIQLGYAYNFAFSRRLLLGLSATFAPGIKHITMNDNGTLTNIAAEEVAAAANSYYGTDQILPDNFRMDVNRTQFGYDFFGHASLTYNFNRWKFGVNAGATAYIYHSNDANVRSIYGNANLYVGYCFGRKKQYRWNGKNRQAYIMAALTKKEIEEMTDTSTVGNIANSHELASSSEKKTSYHTDNLNFTVNGCDLVKGPDGTYGSYTIEDGYITPGQDSEGRLKPGTVIPVGQNGGIKIYCGHDKSFHAATWWKNQVTARQTPTSWYPEMLHYALKGKLTLWVRSYRFGTTKPVKLVIKDFCVNHGKDAHSFSQVACKNFYSHSAYSIVGNIGINGHKMRIYIESKDNGKKNSIFIWKLKASYLDWMKDIPDNRPISRISILGAHNAGSASLPEGFMTSTVHAQNLSLNEQMEDGIRAFDIRLKDNMKFGRMLECREGMPEALDSMRSFLNRHPSEVLVALIGSDEGGTKWSKEMQQNYSEMMKKYSDLLVDSFSPSTPLGQVRGKILVLRRQKDCPYGKLVTFEDNCTFNYQEFFIEDTYREHKTYKKIKLVESHIREAHENVDPNKWYWTFTNIKWNFRHHRPYYSAWGGKFLRKPMNPSLRNLIEDKNYTNFGIVFVDFYNDHCDYPQLTETVINSNFSTATVNDYVPAGHNVR